jgi:hypothetical protein
MKTLAYVKKPDVAVGVWKVDSEPVPQWVIDRMVATRACGKISQRSPDGTYSVDCTARDRQVKVDNTYYLLLLWDRTIEVVSDIEFAEDWSEIVFEE